MRFVTYAYFKFSCSARPPTTTGLHTKKKVTQVRTVEICREGCEGRKKKMPPTNPARPPPRRQNRYTWTTTTGSPEGTYQEEHGVTPSNIPPTCSLYRTRRISAASAHAKLYVSEVWGGNRYPGQSYIKANCYVPMFRRRPWWYIARCVNYIIARAPSSLSQLKYSTHERTHPRCPIPDAFPNPAFS